MSRHTIGNLVITLAPEWCDVTQDIQTPGTPFTLARPKGVGALQFSIASYTGGANPDIKLETLKKLLQEFAQSRELGPAFDVNEGKNHLLIYAASFALTNQFVRVWYCSNGRDTALVTYVCEKGREINELADCEKMVSQLEFRSSSRL